MGFPPCYRYSRALNRNPCEYLPYFCQFIRSSKAVFHISKARFPFFLMAYLDEYGMQDFYAVKSAGNAKANRTNR